MVEREAVREVIKEVPVERVVVQDRPVEVEKVPPPPPRWPRPPVAPSSAAVAAPAGT